MAGNFDSAGSVGQFVLVVLGGLLLGAGDGLHRRLASCARFDDYLVETVLTVILAYGTYFLAEQLHVSGVIAVVAAGLVRGQLRPAGQLLAHARASRWASPGSSSASSPTR